MISAPGEFRFSTRNLGTIKNKLTAWEYMEFDPSVQEEEPVFIISNEKDGFPL